MSWVATRVVCRPVSANVLVGLVKVVASQTKVAARSLSPPFVSEAPGLGGAPSLGLPGWEVHRP
jgi:hypothetical protein